jgi:hypothetical protein
MKVKRGPETGRILRGLLIVVLGAQCGSSSDLQVHSDIIDPYVPDAHSRYTDHGG